MSYDLKTLLLDESLETPTYGLLVPETPITQGTVYERLYGCEGYKASSGFWDGRTSYSWAHSREVIVFDLNHRLDQWTPVFTANGSGFLSNIYGLDKNLSYRITVDGGEKLTLTNVSSRTKGILWGNHHTGKSNKHPSGYFFYVGFDEFSDQYLVNFIKGAVRFEEQLKVECLLKKEDHAHYIALDYLMDGEI